MSGSNVTTPGRLRPRRLRRTPALRDLVAETTLKATQLIMPHFVVPKPTASEPIASMPGIAQMGIETLVARVAADLELGIVSVLLFGHPEAGGKTPDGAAAAAANGAVQSAVRALKQRFADDLVVMTDVCLCAYTDHGHCGHVAGGRIVNDASLRSLADAALSHAAAGADVVAPSDMMDGRVLAIREALDAAGFTEVAIGSYCTKYASAFYGPFRDALDSAPRSGDKKTYQMDPANAREALRELMLDESEGADWVMVKPGLVYADIIRLVRDHTALPVAAYHVSGEYAMLRAAAERGWLDYDRCLLESLLALKRAGADVIFTYGALDAARLLRG